MTNPQQPELARKRLGATSQDSAKVKAETVPMEGSGTGPTPHDQKPGWQQAGTRPAKRRDEDE